MEYMHGELTNQVLACFYEVYNVLGFGFLEKVYEHAMLEELRRRGVRAEHQVPIPVQYKGVRVGDYYADILVEDKVLLELKASECLVEEHEAQLVNYLHATRIEVGLLLNFGKKPEVRRKIFTNDRKPPQSV